MKYISIDIETTGLNPIDCQIVEFGAVIEDTKNILPIDELPRFQSLIIHKNYTGTPYALAMHKEIFQELADPNSKAIKHYVGGFVKAFCSFLKENGFELEHDIYTITVAGKNFGVFDKLFLEALPEWNKRIKIRQRILDPAILYWNPYVDETLPNLKICLDRAEIKGVSGKEIAHTAIEDAIDVIHVLRNKYELLKFE